MSTETEYQLTENQWDTLRMLRPAILPPAKLNRYVLDQLVAMGLVALSDTRSGAHAHGPRRGSARLSATVGSGSLSRGLRR